MRPWDVRHKRDDVPEEGGGVIKLQWGSSTDHSEPAKVSADVIKLVKGSGDASE
jgi:hypothetical protein